MSVNTPFVPLPLNALSDDRLSAGAVRILLVLQEHARKKNICWPSQARMAKRARCSERSVRSYLDQLEGADYISVVRRGKTQTNLYVIHSTAGKTEGGDRQKRAVELEKKEFEKGIFDSYPHFVDIVDNSDSTDIPDSSLPEPEKIVCPAPIAILISDIAKEMRCQAPRSSQTRIAKIHRASGLDTQTFISECYAARSITRNRLGRIQRRNKGQVMPMPYLLKVLENRVNPSPTRTEKTRFKAVEAPVSSYPVTKEISTPEPVFMRSEPSVEATDAFWNAIRDATGMPALDLREYCKITGRPPISSDTARSLSIFRDAKRRKG